MGHATCAGEKWFEDPDADDTDDVNPVIHGICLAEVTYRRMEMALKADGKLSDVETTMNIASNSGAGNSLGFPSGIMESGKR